MFCLGRSFFFDIACRVITRVFAIIIDIFGRMVGELIDSFQYLAFSKNWISYAIFGQM